MQSVPGAVSLTHVGQARTQGPPSTTSRRPGPSGYATWSWSGRAGRARPRSWRPCCSSSGAINRAGSVTEGTTVSDFEEPEHAHQRSVSLAVAPLVHAGTKVNLLDTPGYADFAGEVRAGLRAADAALFVIAANDVGRRGDPAACGASAPRWACRGASWSPSSTTPAPTTTASSPRCAAAFGDTAMSVLVPGARRGTDDRASATCSTRPAPTPTPRRADRGDHRGVRGRGPDGPLPRPARRSSEESLVADLETRGRTAARSTRWSRSCATTGVGCAELLDLVVAGFPSPLRAPAARGVPPPTARRPAPLACDPEGPLVAEVVKTTSDPYVGRVSVVRVFSGTAAPGPRRCTCRATSPRSSAPTPATRTTTTTSASGCCRSPSAGSWCGDRRWSPATSAA